MSVALAPVLAAASTVAACSSSTGCTEAGCGSQVTFGLSYELEAEKAYVVEACVDDFCRSETLAVPDQREPGALPMKDVGDLGLHADSDIVYLALPDERILSGTHRAALTVRDADGAVVSEYQGDVTFERVQPNGPTCPPTCWWTEVST